MTVKDQAYVAERVDKFQKTIVIGFLVLAVAYGVEISQFWAQEGTREILEDISFWLSVLVIIIILPRRGRFQVSVSFVYFCSLFFPF